MDNQNQYGKSKFVTASMLLGILSAVLLTVSLFVPAIDLSAYHAQVQIRYSIMKICENVGLISDMWRGIPIGILIAAVGMLVLSFVRIPPLKAIPCMIVVCMIIIALVDMGNVTAWISKMLARFISSRGILRFFCVRGDDLEEFSGRHLPACSGAGEWYRQLLCIQSSGVNYSPVIPSISSLQCLPSARSFFNVSASSFSIAVLYSCKAVIK